MLRIVLVLFASFIGSMAWANPVSGAITRIVFETEQSHFQRVGYVSIQIADQDTGRECAFLYLSPEDESAIAFVQEAFVQGLEIRVYYEEKLAPWGLGACPIKTIEAIK